jgi:hypothetical protein
MDKFKANPSPKLNDVIEEERKKITVLGEFDTASLTSAVKKRLDGDLSLIGLDTSDVAQKSTRSFLDGRRPDWKQPGFGWYQATLLIPFTGEPNEDGIVTQGKEVELQYATLKHLEGYAEIRFAGLQAFMKAEKLFKNQFKWIKDNLQDGENLGDLMNRS